MKFHRLSFGVCIARRTGFSLSPTRAKSSGRSRHVLKSKKINSQLGSRNRSVSRFQPRYKS